MNKRWKWPFLLPEECGRGDGFFHYRPNVGHRTSNEYTERIVTKECSGPDSRGGASPEKASRKRAPRNRTTTVQPKERAELRSSLHTDLPARRRRTPVTGVAMGDCREWIPLLPANHVDLLFLDPPYNLSKDFNGRRFKRLSTDQYTEWLDATLATLVPLLKSTASIYICGDWYCSSSIFEAASRHFHVHNRITWEREKGRGAKSNWKNASEDIWFCTMSGKYTFEVDRVKTRRRVVAPYKDSEGRPKDWVPTEQGGTRDTHPSNLWTDITVPFWSMRENTDHPTQKSEKLLAKLILASSNPHDFVLDPFHGSGTTAVVAKKLDRRCLGIDIDEDYCLVAAKRLSAVESNDGIQGYQDGVFLHRNA